MLLSKDYECDYIPVKESVGELSNNQKEQISIIKNKIIGGGYNLETVECPCGSSSFSELAKKDRYGLPCTTCICKECGLIQINPRMTEESYKDFYLNDYRKLEDKVEWKDMFKKQYNKGKIITYLLEEKSTFSAPCNVLEVGCYTGGLIKAFSDKGCSCVGIDLDKEAVNKIDFAETYNCTVNELDSNFNGRFDLIIYMHVFEHILNPKREIANIKRLLSPEGILFIAVPSLVSIDKAHFKFPFTAFCQLAHVYGFTLPTLFNLFISNGFISTFMDQTPQHGIHSIFVKQSITYNNVMNFLIQHESNRKEFNKCISQKGM